jgi:hypothetical protein
MHAERDYLVKRVLPELRDGAGAVGCDSSMSTFDGE